MPSIFGEDAVLRILDKQALTDEMQGPDASTASVSTAARSRDLRRLASEPYGMLLVTGPTGSGKTTTLYAAITEINHGHDKIITIEDPVEYQLPGVLQIPVNEKKGLTFARGLRSILRHDPDKIMVGEIRDPETAQIAVQSALTGHLVFTTVHANNVFDVIGRFMHMGVDPYSFVSALNGIVAQRLVRVNCPHCADDAARRRGSCSPNPGSPPNDARRLRASARARLRPVPRHRLQGAQGDRRDPGAERRDARADRRARADPPAQGGRRRERHALPARGRARAGARGRNHLQEINRVTFVG